MGKVKEGNYKSYINVLGLILGRTLSKDLRLRLITSCLRLITSCLGLRNGLLGLPDHIPYCEGVLKRLVFCRGLHLLGFRNEGI